MKMIQISDLHLSEDNDYQVFDVNTYKCAQKIVHHISEYETDADCLIISGDISNDESAASYKHLMEIIKDQMISVVNSDYHSFSIPLTVDINSGENWGSLH